MTTALVAGGAGFIGRSMCARLLEQGHAVVCVDNLVTGTAAAVKELAVDERFSFLELDLSTATPEQILEHGPYDRVLNLACPASPADFVALSLEILDVGSRGVATLLEVTRASGARYLQASTSEVYGDPQVHPQPETYWGNVNPIGVRSVYDEAKRFGEALVMAHHRRHGTEVRIARIFNTYGPGMRADDGRVISNFVTQALAGSPLTVHGDGSQTRSLVYVQDEVTGLLALLESDLEGPVNIGSEDEIAIGDLARLVVELAGSSSEIAFVDRPADDPELRRPDLTRARSGLGWQPSTPLRHGLAATIEWFRHPAGDRFGHPAGDRFGHPAGDRFGHPAGH